MYWLDVWQIGHHINAFLKVSSKEDTTQQENCLNMFPAYHICAHSEGGAGGFIV